MEVKTAPCLQCNRWREEQYPMAKEAGHPRHLTNVESNEELISLLTPLFFSELPQNTGMRVKSLSNELSSE